MRVFTSLATSALKLRSLMVTSLALSVGFAPVSARAQDVTVTSLYEDRSLLAGFLIPLRVESSLLDGGTIESVEVEASDGAVCRTMKDPYLTNHVLVKCDGPTRARLTMRILKGRTTYNVAYGPIEILGATQGYEAVEPAPAPTPSPDVLAGRQLYNAYCVACHSPPASKQGRSAAQIKTALNLQSMISLRTRLTDADIAKLETYLKSP